MEPHLVRRSAATLALCLAVLFTLQANAVAQDSAADSDAQRLTLITDTPDEGFAVALTLSRKAVTETQPNTDVLHALRPAYSHDGDSLIAMSHVVAANFRTVAVANDYWRDVSADGEELSLITETPDEGFAVALTLSRKAVTETQPNTDVLHALRPAYSHDGDSLIGVSHVAAENFQTVAAANDYWRP